MLHTSHCDEYSQNYVLGFFTPTVWDEEGDCFSLSFGELPDQRVVLTDTPVDLQGLEKRVSSDVYQAECACDCACA
jgi:hypothetical protein